MLRRVSHPAEGVTHWAIEVPRPKVELMTDAALRATIPDDAAPRIPPAPALRPCADMGILDEQPWWVDVAVRKLEPVGNGVEVPPDQVSLQRQAVVLPPAVTEQRTAADSMEQRQRFMVRGVQMVPQHCQEVRRAGVPSDSGLVDECQPAGAIPRVINISIPA